MSAQPRELRVLDGVHAGARAPLAPRLTIGSAPDNDIVLSDPGIAASHAELVWDDAADRWRLLRDDIASEHGIGEAVRLGPVRLTVASANEPFDAVVEAPVVAPSIQVPDEPAAPAADESGAPPPVPTAAPALPPRRDAAAVLALVLASVLVMLLLGGVAAVLWLAPAPVRPAPPAPPPLPTLARVQQVVDAQGLKGRVQVVMGPAGLPRVEGLLDDEALIESLGSALARLQPRPAMRVWSPATLRSALREAGIALPPGLSLRISPQGAAVLSGPVAGPEAVQALKQQLRVLLPASVPWVDELLQPPQLAERFLADARAQGFVLDGQLQGDLLRLSARIPDDDLPRWERWLPTASRRHAGALRLAVVLERAVPAAPVPARSPLAIRSVVGGAEPLLVLADGTRLLVGGRHDGWQLLAIDDRAIVFEGRGRTLQVPR